MRVLFVSANRTEINMRSVPLGLACVASAVRQAGHRVEVLDLVEAGDPYRAMALVIQGFRPEVIGISIRNIDDQNMQGTRLFLDEDKETIEWAKNLSGVPVVLGGAGYSIFPEAILTGTQADFGIQGEGEEAFRLLLERLEGGQSLIGVPGLYVKGKGLQGTRVFSGDLDQFPLPDVDLFPESLTRDEGVWLPVQTRRGCPMGCTYCSTAVIEGTTIRKRSPQKVVEWMARMSEKGVRQVYFVDNTFNLPASYAKDLCRELTRAALGITWRCIVYPGKMDEELVAAMARAGCIEAAVGFESGCEGILAGMRKRFRAGDVRQTCALLKRYGIRRMGFLLLGGPGETRESVEETLTFADSLDLDALKVSIGIRIYPYSPLALQAREEKIITSADDLLIPRFYVVPGLEEWMREIVASYAVTRPNWIVEQ